MAKRIEATLKFHYYPEENPEYLLLADSLNETEKIDYWREQMINEILSLGFDSWNEIDEAIEIVEKEVN